MNNILERISHISDLEGVSIGKIEQLIGASKGVLYKAIQKNTDIQCKWLIAFVDNFPQYNTEWIVTGRGNKLKCDINQNQKDTENLQDEEKILILTTENNYLKEINDLLRDKLLLLEEKFLNKEYFHDNNSQWITATFNSAAEPEPEPIKKEPKKH